jgi:hypothetical protein
VRLSSLRWRHGGDALDLDRREREHVDARFDAVDQRFDAVDRRFEAVDQRLEGFDKRFDRLEDKVDAQNLRIDDVHRSITLFASAALALLGAILAAVIGVIATQL